jgi:two-component system NtrC family sensor kinase
VRVVRAYQPGVPRLDADGKQLGQVFLNLMLNAVQAMPGGGCVTIATRLFEGGQLVESSSSQLAGTRDPESGDQLTNRQIDYSTNQLAKGGWVEVAVSDTGPGIPPHILKDIFTPFVSTKHRGTGLGLSVSRRIVEDHGGWIEAESVPDCGATFRVFLPLASSDRRVGERPL